MAGKTLSFYHDRGKMIVVNSNGFSISIPQKNQFASGTPTLSERIKKLNDLLRDEVGKILYGELELDEDVLVTVSRAAVSPTLEHATVWISVLPKEQAQKVLEKINRQIYHLQQLLNKRLAMHPVPKIMFEVDTAEDRASQIEAILQKIEE